MAALAMPWYLAEVLVFQPIAMKAKFKTLHRLTELRLVA
jgi:hypothetical protein